MSMRNLSGGRFDIIRPATGPVTVAGDRSYWNWEDQLMKLFVTVPVSQSLLKDVLRPPKQVTQLES